MEFVDLNSSNERLEIPTDADKENENEKLIDEKSIDNTSYIDYNLLYRFKNKNKNTTNNNTDDPKLTKFEIMQSFITKLIYVGLLSCVLWKYSMTDLLILKNMPISILSCVFFFLGLPLTFFPMVILYRK